MVWDKLDPYDPNDDLHSSFRIIESILQILFCKLRAKFVDRNDRDRIPVIAIGYKFGAQDE